MKVERFRGERNLITFFFLGGDAKKI